jgi:head-tail adaptor
VTGAGQLDRRVAFRQRAAGSNGALTGAWTDVVTRDARIQPLKGGEGVQAARMAGQQPVIITVRRDATTETVDNSWSARDARDTTIVWDIASVIRTEDRAWIEILAVQRMAGGEEDE